MVLWCMVKACIIGYVQELSTLVAELTRSGEGWWTDLSGAARAIAFHLSLEHARYVTLVGAPGTRGLATLRL